MKEPAPEHDDLPPVEAKEKKSGRARTILLIVLAALLIAGGALGAYFVISMKNDAKQEAAVPAETDKPAEVTSEPEPERTPSPQEIAAEKLEQMGYLGDAAACTMTAEQARVYANIIRNTAGPVVYAAIFDGGNGVPMLWVARADGETPVSSVDHALSKTFDDKIYGLNGTSAQEMPWMTVLLRAGTDGVMVKISRDSGNLQFFYLHNGRPDSAPFATGLRYSGGDASYNGTYLGKSADTTFGDFYRQAVGSDTVLLQAISGYSDTLSLTGSWTAGSEMSTLLDEYAAALS